MGWEAEQAEAEWAEAVADGRVTAEDMDALSDPRAGPPIPTEQDYAGPLFSKHPAPALDWETRKQQARRDRGNPISNSTIEFVHGGYVHVEHSPDEIHEHIQRARSEVQRALEVDASLQLMVRLTRLDGDPAGRQARGFREFDVNPDSIAAVFPLTSRSNRD